MHVDSIRSDNSTEEIPVSRNAHRDPNLATPIPSLDGNHFKIPDVDPDGIQVMGEVELQHLPEAVNREIVKNSQEIVFEEETEIPKENYTEPVRQMTRRTLMRHPLLDEERKSLNGSKRNLHSKIARAIDEDRRSLDDSRRNLNGSKKYLLLALDRNHELNSRESLIGVRRHTGSKERLNVLRRNVCLKGSKETPAEFGTFRKRLNSSDDDRLSIERERSPKRMSSQRLREVVTADGGSDGNLMSNGYNMPSKLSQSSVGPMSPVSELSPESGFYEGNQSSPECNRRDFRFSSESAITRNRRSYENAQLQDVNESLSRLNGDDDVFEGPVKDLVNNAEAFDKCGGKNGVTKQAVSYTSV